MRPLDPRWVRRSPILRRHLVVTAVLAVVGAALMIAQSATLASVIVTLVDTAQGVRGPGVGPAAVALASVLITRALLAWLLAVLSARAATRVRAELQHAVVDAVLSPVSGAQREHSAARVAGVVSGLERLDPYVSRFLPQMATSVVVPAMVVVALAVVDPVSAAIVMVTVPLVVGFLILVGLATQERLERRWDELQRLGRHLADVVAGLPTLRALGRDQAASVRAVGERHRRATREALRTAFLSSLVLELFSTLSVALVAVVAGLRLVTGGIDLWTGLFVIVLAPEAYLPLRRLGAGFHDARTGVDAASEALDLVNGASPVRSRERTDVPVVAPRSIAVQGVAIQRRGGLHRLPDFTVRPGQILGVAGPSGSGKSTLLELLIGLVAPSEGRVVVETGDGALVDLSAVDLDLWHRGIAWVPQDPAMLSGTVADAVRLGAPRAGLDEVEGALADAGAADLTSWHEVGEAGRALSAGERRRVAVARALLRVRHGGAWVLLLDEPTAGLDPEHEAQVLRSVQAARDSCGVAVVLVSHRPAALDVADQVIDLAGLGVRR